MNANELDELLNEKLGKTHCRVCGFKIPRSYARQTLFKGFCCQSCARTMHITDAIDCLQLVLK